MMNPLVRIADWAWRPATVILGLGITLSPLWIAAVASPSAEQCRPYATAFTDLVIKETWEHAYSYCRAEGVDDPPAMPRDLDAAMAIVEPLWYPPGSCPAAAAPVGPPAARPPLAAVARPPPARVSAPPDPAAFCARVHRRVAWQGKSWRCR